MGASSPCRYGAVPNVNVLRRIEVIPVRGDELGQGRGRQEQRVGVFRVIQNILALWNMVCAEEGQRIHGRWQGRGE